MRLWYTGYDCKGKAAEEEVGVKIILVRGGLVARILDKRSLRGRRVRPSPFALKCRDANVLLRST